MIPSFEPQTTQDTGCLPVVESNIYDVIMTREGSFICRKFPKTSTPSIFVVILAGFTFIVSGNPDVKYPEPDQKSAPVVLNEL